MNAQQSHSLNMIVRNALSLLTSDVLNKATTFLVYAMVSRWLGAVAFGQLSLGLLLFYLFQVVSTAGIPTLITRDIARRPGRAGRAISGGMCAAAIAGSVATLAMAASPLVLNYHADTSAVIAVLSLGLIPYAWALVIESAFRGLEQMHWIAASNVFANAAKVGGAIWLLTGGWGVLAIAAWLVVVRVLIMLTGLLLYVWANGWFWRRIRLSYLRVLFGRTSTFFGIDSVIAVWGSVDALLLSKLMTEAEVGIYCAAAQLLQPVLLVFRAMVASIFPRMCQRALLHQQELIAMVRWMVGFLLIVGVPVTLLLPGLASIMLELAYDAPEFQLGVPLMQIGAFYVLLQALTSVLGHSLWAVHRERWTLRIVIINVIANVILGLVLIPQFGMIGAAVASLTVGIVNAAQHYLACKQYFGASPVDRQVLIPLSSGILGGCVLLLVFPINSILAAASGATAYAVALAMLLRRAHGGWSNIRTRYFLPLLGTAT